MCCPRPGHQPVQPCATRLTWPSVLASDQFCCRWLSPDGLFALALGPHPQRELTLTLRRGVPWPRRSVAAGAPVLPVLPVLPILPILPVLPFLPFLPVLPSYNHQRT